MTLSGIALLLVLTPYLCGSEILRRGWGCIWIYGLCEWLRRSWLLLLLLLWWLCAHYGQCSTASLWVALQLSGRGWRG